ncbi:MAG: phosphate ABC transporter permease PstA [Candidatus Krumholzibacteriia bacterium]
MSVERAGAVGAADGGGRTAGPPAPRRVRRDRSADARRGGTLLARGEPLVWLTGGALLLCLAMILGLLALVIARGMSSFRPLPVVRLDTTAGAVMGEVTRVERQAAVGGAPGATTRRRLVRLGNFELTGEHFRWVGDGDVTAESRPAWALVVERAAWGRFSGELRGLDVAGEPAVTGPEAAWRRLPALLAEVGRRRDARRRLETRDIGAVNRRLEAARLQARAVELRLGAASPAACAARAALARAEAVGEGEFARLRARIDTLNGENARYALVVATADGVERRLPLADIVRVYPANRLGAWGRLRVYLARWGEFLTAGPREANSEGGVLPAIFGTVVMTLLMSLAVLPLGVLAALYLREYAKGGAVVSAVRIAVNNLAGVPSIVFGVFGLGFFCYILGGGIDRLFFPARLPTPTFGTGGLLWASLTLALLTLPVVIVATEEALAAVPGSMREGSYACGASKWQTIRRIVLPRALPGIMTGMILAMARGAGEVAPLMLVGAVKLAPELPIDAVWPFVHPQRSFMHLGFHIYDLGFQSQNSEAARPLVFTTTLLLIALIAALNVGAILLRRRLRRRFLVSQF